MAELLLELLCEEIPARMQAGAADDLRAALAEAFAAQSLTFDVMTAFVTPRRLVIHALGLPARSPDVAEEKRGPRVDAPDKAIEGFLKSTGLARTDLVARGEGKAAFYYAMLHRPGRPTADVIAELVPAVMRGFNWPKSMRWGERSLSMDSLRWVRPLQSVVCLLDGTVVPFEIDGIRSGNTTRGHRFMASSLFTVDGFEDYRGKLRRSRVLIDADERRRLIEAQARSLAAEAGLELVDDPGLLTENAGLTEWPVPLIGSFDAAFLDVPPEVIQLTMRTNQKYFALRHAATGALSSHFICTANIEASDGGRAIVEGNQKVLAARLSDARFFWDQDRKTRLDDLLPKLKDIVFHQKLGTIADKVDRIAKLARALAPACNADPDNAERAARLCKADLVTGMVGEFPELQGVMGSYYARNAGEPEDVVQAIREHYAPQGPQDSCPSAPVSMAVSLGDKLDTLVRFFEIDEKPTGSKDPYALRRAALGIIRILTENGLRMPVPALLLDFMADRLKVQQRELGVPHDLIDAVFSLGGEDDLVRLLARVQALRGFLGTADGQSLLAGYKRAANILRIEEKKDGRAYTSAVDGALLAEAEEKALHGALVTVAQAASAAVAAEDFEAAMVSLAVLRVPIDAFFDRVTVNAEEPAVRVNRLSLLAGIRAAVHTVADFSRIES